jgi:hypothetical protein
MLRDYETTPQPAPREPEGVQLAGLMDFLELAARMGRTFTDSGVNDMMDYARRDPAGMFRDNNLFIDPRGDLTLNTGPTYKGRPIPKRDTVEALAKSGAQAVNLRTYLNDLEIGDLMAADLENINVGRVPLGGSNYTAMFRAPTKDERGVIAINADLPKDEIGVNFEHELQHALQFAQGKPQGANPDMTSQEFMDYLVSAGRVDPKVSSGLNQTAQSYGIVPSVLRYYATRGEGEARAAEKIAEQTWRSGKQMSAPPPVSFYTSLPRSMNLTGVERGLLYDIGPDDYADFLKYRQQNLGVKPLSYGGVE